MSDLVEKARAFAFAAHRKKDQRRKYTGEPYEVHLIAVANIVATVTQDEHMLAAAYLHDVVEDTDVSLHEIEAHFGSEVAALVENLTDVSRPQDGNRAQRKALDRLHLAQAQPSAQTVKLADIISNVPDIAQHDASFGRIYIREAEELLKVLSAGHPQLQERAWETIRTSRELLSRPNHFQLEVQEKSYDEE